MNDAGDASGLQMHSGIFVGHHQLPEPEATLSKVR